jgi:hypothetical protein
MGQFARVKNHIHRREMMDSNIIFLTSGEAGPLSGGQSQLLAIQAIVYLGTMLRLIYIPI